jgi:hypothetical protein
MNIQTNMNVKTNNGELLIASKPLMVRPELAKQIGLNEAIFLQQLHCWLTSDLAKLIDERWWVYNTYTSWQEDNFPFWSLSTIKRVISKLKGLNLIITTSKYNKVKFDQTSWYSIDYSVLEKFELESNRLQEERKRGKLGI